jgi:hypothetical protein
MADYRFYWLDRADHIKDVTVVATDGDENARERGAEMLEASSYGAVEIWAGARCLGQLTKERRTDSGPLGAAADYSWTTRAN